MKVSNSILLLCLVTLHCMPQGLQDLEDILQEKTVTKIIKQQVKPPTYEIGTSIIKYNAQLDGSSMPERLSCIRKTYHRENSTQLPSYQCVHYVSDKHEKTMSPIELSESSSRIAFNFLDILNKELNQTSIKKIGAADALLKRMQEDALTITSREFYYSLLPSLESYLNSSANLDAKHQLANKKKRKIKLTDLDFYQPKDKSPSIYQAKFTYEDDGASGISLRVTKYNDGNIDYHAYTKQNGQEQSPVPLGKYNLEQLFNILDAAYQTQQTPTSTPASTPRSNGYSTTEPRSLSSTSSPSLSRQNSQRE